MGCQFTSCLHHNPRRIQLVHDRMQSVARFSLWTVPRIAVSKDADAVVVSRDDEGVLAVVDGYAMLGLHFAILCTLARSSRRRRRHARSARAGTLVSRLVLRRPTATPAANAAATA